MTLLHVPYIRYIDFHYAPVEQFNPVERMVLIALMCALSLIALFSIASWIGSLLRQQTSQHMKFIYQLYPWSVVNQKPSIVEQTEAQAIEAAKEMSLLYGRLVIVRYPDDRSILCIAENGELTELDTLKTLNSYEKIPYHRS